MAIIYFWRHGIAEDVHGRMKDADRKLTPEGKRKLRKAAQGFKALVGKKAIVKILTSPLARARETAEIVAEVLDVKEVEVLEEIAPPGDLGAVLKEVRRAGSVERGVIVVGHEPILGHWAGQIAFAKSGHLQMKKGGVAAVRMVGTAGQGELVGLWEPRVLKRLS
ncbi:MAG: phosphohistidine phosphatase SixA [Phycisphaerae bacterium]